MNGRGRLQIRDVWRDFILRSLTSIVRSFKNPASIAYLKNFERQSIARTSLTTPPKQSLLPLVPGANASEYHTEAEDDWRPQMADEEEEMEEGAEGNHFEAAQARKAILALPALEEKRVIAKEVMAISNAHEKEKNKENLDQRMESASGRPKPRAFIDPQESAERVTWDESQPSNKQKKSSQKRKQGAQPTVEEAEMSDPSEDESFQQNNRTAHISERRDMAPTATRRTAAPARKLSSRPARPARLSTPPDEEDEESGQEDDDITRQIRREVELHNRGTPAGSQPPSRSQAQIAEQQRRINQLAKNQVRARAATKVQTRRSWSDEETSTLIEYIMEHGTSYAFIKKLDESDQNVLEGRDQIALKDKARNIKTDYLK